MEEKEKPKENKVLGYIKKNVVLILVFIALLTSMSLYYVMAQKPVEENEKTHYHAGFVVFENDEKLDFSDFKYMRVKPCGEDDKHSDSPEEIQDEKAHLHDNVGDVIHVEQEGPLWRDLFTNIKYPIDYNNATAFLNGVEVDNFENTIIQPNDSIVILIGENKENHIDEAVDVYYIEEQAEKSVDCGE